MVLVHMSVAEGVNLARARLTEPRACKTCVPESTANSPGFRPQTLAIGTMAKIETFDLASVPEQPCRSAKSRRRC